MTQPPEADALFDDWHETTIRVRYAETDRMGVVYHANYLVWFEIGRTEFCRARGFAYKDMEENDQAFLVVAESDCRYKAPANYDDLLIIRTHVTERRRRSVRFGYEIIRADDGLPLPSAPYLLGFVPERQPRNLARSARRLVNVNQDSVDFHVAL